MFETVRTASRRRLSRPTFARGGRAASWKPVICMLGAAGAYRRTASRWLRCRCPSRLCDLFSSPRPLGGPRWLPGGDHGRCEYLPPLLPPAARRRRRDATDTNPRRSPSLLMIRTASACSTSTSSRTRRSSVVRRTTSSKKIRSSAGSWMGLWRFWTPTRSASSRPN